MIPIPQFQVDAFTDKPFAGNPAAVVLLGQRALDEAVMQQLAAENNLSETAYLTYLDDGAFGIRWFTPTREVDLCGHATLASAHVLWEQGVADPSGPISFRCAAHGDLTCRRGIDGAITLDFPADPPVEVDPPPGLLEALGVEPSAVLRGRDDFLIVLASAQAVRSVAPDFRRLAAVDARGVLVTGPGDTAEHDVVSRCFFPAVGIDEDPVTGSAHCTLGPYWAGVLGRSELRCLQTSHRAGTLQVNVEADRVLLTGHAVTVIRSEVLI